MKNNNELISLSKYNNLINKNVDNYISFIKEYIHINNNELLILIDLTISSNYSKKILSKSLVTKEDYIKVFMYNYNKNIKFLKTFMKIDKLEFNDLIKLINNKKRIYSLFENINIENIRFYLPIILNIISN